MTRTQYYSLTTFLTYSGANYIDHVVHYIPITYLNTDLSGLLWLKL